MTPTLEEVKKVAEDCGAGFIDGYLAFEYIELQAFAQHFKEEGRKEQREIDRTPSQPVRNNTGE